MKYEDVNLKGYATLPELRLGLIAYFAFYNGERPHQGFFNRRPEELHRSGEGGETVTADRHGLAAEQRQNAAMDITSAT